ncbi:hypothetical protein J8J14_24105, partial [Roseomonas sp. SSH11]
YLLLSDVNGQRHALAPGAVPAICEVPGEGTSALLLPGGRLVVVEADVETVALALSGEGR